LEGAEIYLFIRAILTIFILSSLIISILLITQRQPKQLINGFTLGMFTVITIVVSGINLIIMGYLADGIYAGGDVLSTYLFLIVLVLCVVNMLLYSRNAKSA